VNLPAADEVDDLNLIALAHRRRIERGALQDDQVVFDRHSSRVDVELSQKTAHGDRAGQLLPVAVQRDDQRLSVARSPDIVQPAFAPDGASAFALPRFGGTSRGHLAVQLSFSTRFASTVPLVCFVPFASTLSPFASVAHVVLRNSVLALVVTVVAVPTLNVTTGQARD
jgi:hypothetical protein